MLTRGVNVLVTGGTGLIGGELLRALIDHPIGKVWALVRSQNQVDPAIRLQDRLQRAGGGNGTCEDHGVIPVSGDISADQLGLSREDYEEIRGEVDIIIHSAAETSFIRSDSCSRTNIAGSRHLVEFCRNCRREPLFVYISTAFVSGVMSNKIVHEDESLRPENEHHNEYTRSKAIAEQMVRDSGLRTLIVRPSIVLSAGLSCVQFARAILWFVPLLKELDALPVNPAGRPDVVPVSFVVDSIIRLLERPSLKYDCYHLSAGLEGSAPYSMLSDVVDRFYERETPLTLLRPSEWTREMHRRVIRTPHQRKIFSSLRNYLPFLNMNVLYDHGRLREELGDQFPALSPLQTYLADMLSVLSTDPVAGRLLSAVRA